MSQRRPILSYDSGFPTALPNASRLADMLRELGEPRTIERVGGSFLLEWAPLYPGVPIPEYRLANPWPMDRRTLVRVSLG